MAAHRDDTIWEDRVVQRKRTQDFMKIGGSLGKTPHRPQVVENDDEPCDECEQPRSRCRHNRCLKDVWVKDSRREMFKNLRKSIT